MSDGLDLQSSAARLCSCSSATIKKEKAFDFSSSSITHLALYALSLLLAPLNPGWHQYNWGGGCSGLNLCTLPLLTPYSCCKKRNPRKMLFTLHPHRTKSTQVQKFRFNFFCHPACTWTDFLCLRVGNNVRKIKLCLSFIVVNVLTYKCVRAQ